MKQTDVERFCKILRDWQQSCFDAECRRMEQLLYAEPQSMALPSWLLADNKTPTYSQERLLRNEATRHPQP